MSGHCKGCGNTGCGQCDEEEHMNDRIKDLLEDATEIHDDRSGNSYRVVDYKIFAELIVNQCVEIVREEYLPVLQDEDMMTQEHWKGYVGCGVDSVASIKHYFYGESDGC